MPWITPTLRQTRELVRDEITAALSGAILIGNNVLRVMADAKAGLAHLVLRYIDWLALQLLPDTAETEWLDRHGAIWLTNSDGTIGRKAATYSEGTALVTGTAGLTIPEGTELSTGGVSFETTEEIVLETTATSVHIRALDPGIIGNLDAGIGLGITNTTIFGVQGIVVDQLLGGTDEETDEQLRTRVLLRIREPPMGGSAADYVEWALAVPGVTRAWASPLEMGIGTVTVRFMEDDLRTANSGFPFAEDIDTVTDYIDSVRPVAIKDRFIESPIPEHINFTISDLVPDSAAIRASIQENVIDMLFRRAAPAYSIDGVARPAQTIFAAWVSEAILQTVGVESFRLIMDDHVMPNRGALGVLGAITYQ